MKKNGFQWINLISIPVIFGLIYFLHAQQQNDIDKCEKSEQDTVELVTELRVEQAEMKNDIKWVIKFLSESDPETADEVNGDTLQ